MAFVTTTEVKSLLQISITTWDSYITSILLIMPDWIIDYCNNHFLNSELYYTANTLTFASQTITDSASGFVTAGFVADMEIYIEGSDNNDGHYIINTAAAGSLVVKNKTFTAESSSEVITICQVRYPEGLKLAVASIIGYLLSIGKSQNVASESTGDYSVSYLTDMPEHILKQLKPYRIVKFV